MCSYTVYLRLQELSGYGQRCPEVDSQAAPFFVSDSLLRELGRLPVLRGSRRLATGEIGNHPEFEKPINLEQSRHGCQPYHLGA